MKKKLVERQFTLGFSEDLDPSGPVLALLTPDEIYEHPERFALLVREDRRIERKGSREHEEPLSRYIAMWANTSPAGGLLAFGISDDGNVQGCKSLEPEKINKIEKVGH